MLNCQVPRVDSKLVGPSHFRAQPAHIAMVMGWSWGRPEQRHFARLLLSLLTVKHLL